MYLGWPKVIFNNLAFIESFESLAWGVLVSYSLSL